MVVQENKREGALLTRNDEAAGKHRTTTSTMASKTTTSSATSPEDEKAVKLQAFVRGAICRAKVSIMVKKLIDELLAARGMSVGDVEAAVAGEKKVSGQFVSSEENENAETEEGGANESAGAAGTEGVTKAVESDPAGKGKSEEEEAAKNSSIGTAGDIINKGANAPLSDRNSSHHRMKFEKGPEVGGLNTESPELQAGPKIQLKNAQLERNSTRHVKSSEELLSGYGERMEAEMQQLLKDIKRVGEQGEPHATFGELFDDEQVANYYEALVGTLKAAKKKGLVEYEGQILLKGISDSVVISLKK
mmetsp:Transcript_6539/g.12036  ORF Transcript_6539/g.12036 Transcript_6539/m.12036 type:complete len:305 (+) Transcript_6539:287-1201(+)